MKKAKIQTGEREDGTYGERHHEQSMEAGIQKRVCHADESLKGMWRLNCGAYLRQLALTGFGKPLESRLMKVSFRKSMLVVVYRKGWRGGRLKSAFWA